MLDSEVYFISGHLDLTEQEFEEHYVPMILDALNNYGRFVVGDARGADTMAQRYLMQYTGDVVVYHMFDMPRNNEGQYLTQGGFTSDDARDEAMTKASEHDIAWVRPGREKSGTQKNLDRRNV